MRVALVEASHWHVPLYLNGLEAPGVKVVGVTDTETDRGAEIAERFRCPRFESVQSLLDRESVDYAFVFGRHRAMPELARKFIDARIPFSIEKPAGLTALDVADLADRAARAHVRVDVPLILRISDLLEKLQSLHTAADRYRHFTFRFIAGSADRYPAAGSAWMLSPREAGGGCTINLAVHFVDLVRTLTREEPRQVSANMLVDPSLGIEIYSAITLTFPSGVIAQIETGYTFPNGPDEQREFSFSIATDKYYVRSGDESISVRLRGRTGIHATPLQLNTDPYYAQYAAIVLNRNDRKAVSIATLNDLEPAMCIIDAAYESNRASGRPVAALGGPLGR